MIKQFRPGVILSESLGIFLRHFIALFVLSCLCLLPTFVHEIYTGVYSDEITQPAELNVDLAIRLLLIFIEVQLLTGAVSFAVFQSIREKPVRIGECLAVGLRRLFPIVGVALSSGIIAFLGSLMCVIPGIMLYCMVYIAGAVCAVERTGVYASIMRSRDLSAEYRWQVFVIVLVIFVVSLLLRITLEIAIESERSEWLEFAATLGLQLFTTTWSAIAACLSYYHMRSIRESFDANEVATVFE